MNFPKPSIGQVFWFVLIPIVIGASIYGFYAIVRLAEPEATKVAVAIQAIGSLVAILIAVAVPAWLQLKTEQGKEEDRKIFAAAFGVHLLPRLIGIKKSLEWTVTKLSKHIEGLRDPKMGVEFDDHSDDIHTQIEFIRENWRAVAQLDGDTARAAVKVVSYYDAALSYVDVEHGVEIMGDGEGNEWHVIDFGRLPNAQGYLEGNRRALEEVKIAIAGLEVSTTGET